MISVVRNRRKEDTLGELGLSRVTISNRIVSVSIFKLTNINVEKLPKQMPLGQFRTFNVFHENTIWGTKVSAKITEYHPENMPVKFNSAYYLVIIFKLRNSVPKTVDGS